MDYIFDTSGYDVEQLCREVSEALGKRAELASRRKIPGIRMLNDAAVQEEPVQVPRRRVVYRRVVGITLIVLGLVMLVLGLVKRESILMCGIVAVAGVAVGVHALWNSFRQVESRPTPKPAANYDDVAENFLSNLARKEPVAVWFSGEGMHLGEIATIGYPEMQYFIETPQGYLVAWGKQATFLQKKDLRTDDEHEFAAYMVRKLSQN